MSDLEWVGVVLAGGASTRMGRDKALIVVDGEALVVRACRVLGEAGAVEVFVIGGDADALAEIGVQRAAQCPVVLVADAYPGEGPLGGIVTAIDRIERSAPVVVLACDLPFVSSEAVRLLVGAGSEDQSVDVVLPVVEGRSQYLHSLWMPSSHDTVRRSFLGGARAVRQPLLAGLRTLEVNPSEVSAYRDVDTPSQLGEINRVRSPRADTPEENDL